jgi:hypothetical protein
MVESFNITVATSVHVLDASIDSVAVIQLFTSIRSTSYKGVISGIQLS